MVTAEVALAGGLAFLAGATDVHGLAQLHDLFVSFMSGNSTMLGVAIGGGDFARAGKAAGVIGLFVGGAAVGALLAAVAGSRHTVVVSSTVTLLLALPLLVPQWTAPLLVVAMGIMNAAMHHASAAAISLTYVTGALVKFGQGLGLWLYDRRADRAWLIQGLLWACLLTGAAGAAVLERRLDTGIAWALPLISAGLTVAATAGGPRFD